MFESPENRETNIFTEDRIASVGIIGSRVLSPLERGLVREYLKAWLSHPNNSTYTNIVFSNGPGVDTIAIEVVEDLGSEFEIIPTLDRSWEGSGGFRDTNRAIVDAVSHVIIITTSGDKDGGPSWTAHYAMRNNVRLTRKRFAVVADSIDEKIPTEEVANI